MQTEVKQLESGKVELTVIATPEEAQQAAHTSVSAFAAQFGRIFDANSDALANLAGIVGEQNAPEALRSLTIDYLMPLALTKAGIVPACSPEVPVGGTLLQGVPFKFTVELYQRPEMELSSYEPVSVTIAAPGSVTEEEVDEQLLMFLRSFKHDQAPRNPATGAPSVAFEDIEADLSELTDEWVAKNLPDAPMKTAADLRDAMRESGNMVKMEQAEAAKRAALMDAVAARLEGEISEDMAQSFAAELIANMEAQAAASQMTLDQVLAQQGVSHEDFMAARHAEARQVLAGLFALDALARHEGLVAQEEDLLAAAEAMAQGADAAALLNNMRETGREFMVREAAQRNLAMAWLFKNAHITVAEAAQ